MLSKRPYYLRPVALAVSVYFIGVHLWTWIYNLSVFLSGRTDFRQLSTAGYMLRIGRARQLYEPVAQLLYQNSYVGPGKIALPFNHPAYEALIFAPFSLFTYRVAYFLFLILNVWLLWLVYELLRPNMQHLADIYYWLPAALFGAFLPIGVALMQGQDSILLLLLLTGSFVAISREKEGLAGAMVAAGLFKFTIALPIAALFLAWRRWRFAAGFALAAVPLAAISIGIVGAAQTRLFVHSLQSMSVALSSRADQARYAISISSMPNLRGIVFGLVGARFANATVQFITLAFSALIMLWAAIVGRNFAVPVRLLLAIVVSVLVSYHFLLHDMSVLFLPIIVAFDRFLEGKEAKSVGAMAILLFVAPLWWSFASPLFYLVCVPIGLFCWYYCLSRNRSLEARIEVPIGGMSH